MTDRYVEPCTLGQARKGGPEQDSCMGIWRKPGWTLASAAFKCRVCRWVIPSPLWTSAERERFFRGEESRCDKCLGKMDLSRVTVEENSAAAIEVRGAS